MFQNLFSSSFAIASIMAMFLISETNAISNRMMIQEEDSACYDTAFGFLLEEASTGVLNIESWNESHGEDACDALVDPSFSLVFETSNHDLSDMDFSLLPKGLEAIYPENESGGTSGPSVSIRTLEGTSVTYQAMGFRLVFPTYHDSRADNQQPFVAEFQISHIKRNDESNSGAPSILEFGVWIEIGTDVNASNAIVGALLDEWRAAVALVETACDSEQEHQIGTDSLTGAVTVTAPTVVGRGDEQNFGNNPIRSRKLQHNPGVPALYDWILSSPSYYSFEKEVSCDGKGDSVWWNFATDPMKISENEMEAMTALLGRYLDPSTCHPVAILELVPLVNKKSLLDAVSANVTKVCIGSPTQISEPSGAFSVGILVGILAPLAVLILL